MNTKIFLKIAWLFILGLLSYLFFVVSFLSPKINNFLTNTEINNSKIQFDKIVSVINEKSRNIENKENFEKEIQLLLSGVILGKSGYAFIFDSKGKIIFDPSGEFLSKMFDNAILPGAEKKYLYEELKKAHAGNKIFEYNWNRVYDPNNYTYQKISWIEYNQKLDWYIVSNIYKDDFSSFIGGINSLILNISMLLFGVLSIIGIFITVKIIAPINKMVAEVQKISVTPQQEPQSSPQSKDEIGFLATQFNTLLDQVENNRKNFEEQVQVKTKEIQDRLYYDELTNLKNRTALEDDIKDSDFVSVALIDIDSFDDINELYGFSTGNLVLVEVAKILNSFALKFGVNAYRIYGNVYCLADKKMMGFARYDEFITELCSIFKNRPIHIEELDLDIFINITLGISIAQEDPIKTAGIALKKAKKANMKFFVYNNEIDTKEMIKKSMYWREKLKTAIEENAVVPFYQPIFNRNNEIVKYETLMRIKDVDEKGQPVYLSPYLFLDISVKTKQYLQLSNQIISKAFSDLSKTTKQVTFNLSFKDILDSDFIISLDKNIDKLENEKKERVVFEILESDYISDYTLLEDFILKYRKQGVKIAIDDFGTGYSNFAHILKIRPNYIKIDGSLIKNINSDKNSYEMVKSIVDFSKALNIKVVAEFVHSKEVYENLLDLGVDEFQGFYLGEPSLKIE
ncbi:MAG: EAL domain-containing protein [Arcobacter sp.]|jgi:EAL domain-containing protein (putative c-di-GMP-specific phosphodiesterase class I)/GGDEF domain-containing protein|uniref:EAL domain-containing protein n=1 Tax=Arcobacter sp. TaxID=1872629 RepID=UPI002582D95D|nr:EAL domain-containing protein [Arcobacter sp.]MDD3008271.1 EAL domain-containing protein [Arcobacter sp.]MDY3204261.1 EAL domain-containing protein [Arcobacter sp.]